MKSDEQSLPSPKNAFGCFGLAIMIYSLLFFLAPKSHDWMENPFLGLFIYISGVFFIWSGIVEFFRLGGGWIAWGVIFLLTLGLCSVALLGIHLIAMWPLL
jgi:hypothetical protein